MMSLMKSKVNDLSNPFEISIISEGLLPLCGISCVKKKKKWDSVSIKAFLGIVQKTVKWNSTAFHSVRLGGCCLLSSASLTMQCIVPNSQVLF